MPKITRIYCNQLICSNKKWRKCRNSAHNNSKCHKHYKPSFSPNSEVGQCCFCQGECNPCSQSCGRCARDMTMQMLGWK